MKYTLTLFFLILLATAMTDTVVQAQTFDDALDYYGQSQYRQAIETLKEIDDDRVPLYTGKSYLALGEYLQAGYYLNLATQSANRSISNEAYYSLSINEFRLKNFSKSLEILYNLHSRRDQAGLQPQALNFYNEILRYITDSQRYRLFWQVDNHRIRHDLIRSAIGRADYSMVKAMVDELEKISIATGDTIEIAQIKGALGTPETYMQSTFRQLQVPEGMVYHVGVALPSFDTAEPEFAVSRNLYFGMSLAAEEFNARNPDKKVFLRFRDTHASPDSVSQMVHELIWNEHADVLVGPLYSETAQRMSQLAENYEIPMLSPLANSDDINQGHNYTFQMNPTFAVHGRQMAAFAVNEMNLDTLAVITQPNSLGRSSALAFRHEVERLGAHIAYFINEDYDALGYDLSTVTEVFTSDQVLADSLGYIPVKGIYAPFTGQAASTLINLLMNDLEAFSSDAVVMGSEEWRDASLTAAQRNNFAIYHTRNRIHETDDDSRRFFDDDFVNRFGTEPDYFAEVGYDAGSYLFQMLERAGNPANLKQVIREAPPYSGLSMEIHFDNSQINQQTEVEPLTPAAMQRMGRASEEEVQVRESP